MACAAPAERINFRLRHRTPTRVGNQQALARTCQGEARPENVQQHPGSEALHKYRTTAFLERWIMNWLTWIIAAVLVITFTCGVDYAQRHLESFVAHRHMND